MHAKQMSMGLLAAGLCMLSLTAMAQDLSKVPGVVINHLPKSTGIYLSSPSIVIMPDGSYIVSHDYFGPNSTEDTVGQSSIFRSTDDGQTWTKQSDVNGAFWSSLFTYDGDLYFMGPYAGSGNWVIRKSTDNGVTWTNPTNATNGLIAVGNYGSSPSRIEIYGGRIWAPATGPRAFSAPVGSDLLVAANWTVSAPVPEEFEWFNENITWTEAQTVVSPQTGLVMMPKIKNHAVTTLLRANPANGQLTFNDQTDFVDIPGVEKKFGATYDPVSQKFYVLSNAVLPAHEGAAESTSIRNTAAIISSKDLYHWDVEQLFLYAPSVAKEAFQYLNFAIDGDDLAVVSRTAFDDGLGGANSAHNNNLITFHRIEDFRNVTPTQVLVTDTNNDRVMRYEVTQTDFWAPLGSFTLGSTFAGSPLDNPRGIAQDAAGNVYIGEQVDGGRILRFDALGNFLNVVATEGVDFTGDPEALIVGPDGFLYMSAAFGTNSDKIYRIDPDTGASTVFVDTNFAGGTLNNPRGLAFGSDGNLYLADRESGQVRKFSGTTGAFLSNLFTTSRPEALTWDELEQKLLASSRSGSDTDLYELALNGSSTKLYDPADVGLPLDIVVIDGEIYWSDFDNDRIYKLKGVNQKVNSVATGINGPGHFLHLAQAPAGERPWLMGGSADWSELTNWFYWGRPDTNYEVAFFGTSANAASTITQNKALILKGLRFRNANAYTLAGSGSLTLEAEAGHSIIDVQLGNHQIQLGITLNSDTDATFAAGSALNLTGQLDLNGHTLNVTGPGTLFANGSVQTNGGTLNVIDGGTLTASSITITNGSTLSGDGQVVGSVWSYGSVSPGQSAGTLHINGAFAQFASGSMHIELAASAHDQLAVTGNILLGGTLELVLEPGFNPNYGDSFDIITSAAIFNAFDVIEGVIVDDNLALAVTYSATTVTVTAALPGDANLDGTINLSDLQILGDHWQSNTAHWGDADFNGDRLVNLADLQVLGDHWNATAGDFDQLAQAYIPEPHSLALLAVAAIGLLNRPRCRRLL
ncbi:MAG: hypothetical protein IT445_16415 [Phycisphaeraceae bacterium]|nr:hypothetical protein [Phycisphaeraceae bacterium]